MMSASFSNYVDLADAIRIELDLNGKEALLEDAEASVHSGWPEPTPLVRPMEPPAPFPCHALGPVLENAARGIEEIVQCPLSLAACSVLAAASLAAQAHVDVIHPATGHALPTSLFILTVAESGERKSAADKEALAVVRMHEKLAVEKYKLDFMAHRNALEAYETARALVKKRAKSSDWRSVQLDLQALGEEPKAPPKPDVIVTEPTFEGLARLFAEGQPSLGLFSAEGGGFLGGHALRDDSRLRALTGLSELWDGSPLRRTRAGEGSHHLTGRRLALHLMVQPSVAPMLLSDDMANGQGFLSRLLVCAPVSTQGSRFQRPPQPWARQSLDMYSTVIGDLLMRSPRMVDNGLDPMALALTDEAMVRWRVFADDMERELAVDGASSSIRGLRNKTPEMALRIGGVLACIEEDREVTRATVERGIELSLFFLSEARRLYEASAMKPEIARAMKLLRWLVERNVSTISLRDIQVHGPGALRDAESVKEAVGILEKHGLAAVKVVHTGRRPSQRLYLSPLADSVL